MPIVVARRGMLRGLRRKRSRRDWPVLIIHMFKWQRYLAIMYQNDKVKDMNANSLLTDVHN